MRSQNIVLTLRAFSSRRLVRKPSAARKPQVDTEQLRGPVEQVRQGTSGSSRNVCRKQVPASKAELGSKYV